MDLHFCLFFFFGPHNSKGGLLRQIHEILPPKKKKVQIHESRLMNDSDSFQILFQGYPSSKTRKFISIFKQRTCGTRCSSTNNPHNRHTIMVKMYLDIAKPTTAPITIHCTLGTNRVQSWLKTNIILQTLFFSMTEMLLYDAVVQRCDCQKTENIIGL